MLIYVIYVALHVSMKSLLTAQDILGHLREGRRLCTDDMNESDKSIFSKGTLIIHSPIHTYSESYIYRHCFLFKLSRYEFLMEIIPDGSCRREFSANELSRLPSMYLTQGSPIVCVS